MYYEKNGFTEKSKILAKFILADQKSNFVELSK